MRNTRGRYRAKGWDAIRTARHEERKGMGMVDEQWEISPGDELAPPWEGGPAKRWYGGRVAGHGGEDERRGRGGGVAGVDGRGGGGEQVGGPRGEGSGCPQGRGSGGGGRGEGERVAVEVVVSDQLSAFNARFWLTRLPQER